MICLSLPNVRCLISTCIPRLFSSPDSSCETILFGGPEPKQSSMHKYAKGTAMPTILEEEPAFSPPSDSALSVKNSAPTRLYTVRILFPHNGLGIMEDIKRNGLSDVVLDAIALHELEAHDQAQDNHGLTKEVFLVDLAVFEAGIPRVLGKYGSTKSVHQSSDDQIILQQSAEGLDSKKALYYQQLHFKYQLEYEKRRQLAKVLGYKIHNGLKNWYEERLEDICDRLTKLGYC